MELVLLQSQHIETLALLNLFGSHQLCCILCCSRTILLVIFSQTFDFMFSKNYAGDQVCFLKGHGVTRFVVRKLILKNGGVVGDGIGSYISRLTCGSFLPSMVSAMEKKLVRITILCEELYKYLLRCLALEATRLLDMGIA